MVGNWNNRKNKLLLSTTPQNYHTKLHLLQLFCCSGSNFSLLASSSLSLNILCIVKLEEEQKKKPRECDIKIFFFVQREPYRVKKLKLHICIFLNCLLGMCRKQLVDFFQFTTRISISSLKCLVTTVEIAPKMVVIF